MTQMINERLLLLHDLFMRLPYGIIALYKDDEFGYKDITKYEISDSSYLVADIPFIKPYLRPMSLMTEDEKKEMHDLISPEGTAVYGNVGVSSPINHFGSFIPYDYMDRVIDYLSSRNLDYNDLIGKGLALNIKDIDGEKDIFSTPKHPITKFGDGNLEDEKKIYDNIPYEDIKQFVQEDLYKYDQENPAPLSLTVLTIIDGLKAFRHYELGEIVGYVLFGYIPEDPNVGVSSMISEIREDDENWFAPPTPMYMSGSWMNNSLKTLQRMHRWYHEHIKEGFANDGLWESRIIKEIVPEEIFREDGLSSCFLFSGPDKE